MTEAVEQSVIGTTFLDNSDDFIQSHIDSHLSPLERERTAMVCRMVMRGTVGNSSVLIRGRMKKRVMRPLLTMQIR